MNKKILHTGVQHYINENISTDILTVLLKKTIFEGISNQELVQQIASKKKCHKKLKTWFQTPKIYYPDKRNIEQSSSEITARYKAKLIQGGSLLDLTGGFGVDSYFFAQEVDHVQHCEIDEGLATIAGYNFEVLGAKNITCHAMDGLRFLKNSSERFDWIYIDPSRRNDLKGKVFRLSDSLPNVPEHLDILFEKATNLLIKTSPLLDLSLGITELRHVRQIHIIAIENEVKEVLWELDKNFEGEIEIKTINHKAKTSEHFDFLIEQEKKAVSSFGAPLKYLYEPNAAILKAGAFKWVGEYHGLKKLHPHTHLYTSDQLIEFPGRGFIVEHILPYSKREINKLKGTQANVSTRNFKESVAQLREKYQITDGGDQYLFFCQTTESRPVALVCARL